MKALSLIFAAALLTVSGCGPSGPDISSVEGTITMDGKPLPNAMVLFLPEEGRPAGDETDEEGHYELNFSGGRKGAEPGNYKVRISTAKGQSIKEDGSLTDAVPETVPRQFNQATTLVAVVKEGESNEFNFDITSEGEVTQDESY